jgi:membrane-bound serine protease (ClpP class)
VLTGAAPAHGSPKAIREISIRGTINPASADYLESAIRVAVSQGNQALIVQLDTPGGLVSSVQSMAQAIDQSSIPVIVWVTPSGASATSAGALLTLASHWAVMSPGSHIGAAHPVDSSGQEVQGKVGEKLENDLAAFAKGLAERRKRPVEIAEGMVRKSLSLTAQEALAQKVVDRLASTREELLDQVNGQPIQLSDSVSVRISTPGTAIVSQPMSWGQSVLNFLSHPNIATILISLGMLLIYAEISSPGLGIAGILGGISLLCGFLAFQMLPVQTGGLILLFVGVGLFLIEPFVTAHGAFAFGGILSFILGVLWVIDPTQTTLAISPRVWVPIVSVMAAFAGLMSYLAASTRRRVTAAAQSLGGRSLSGLSDYSAVVEQIAPDGKSGKVKIRGEIWNFQSDGEVAVGDSVQVIQVEGFLVTVRMNAKSQTP